MGLPKLKANMNNVPFDEIKTKSRDMPMRCGPMEKLFLRHTYIQVKGNKIP